MAGGKWPDLPSNVLEHIFCYLDLNSARNCALVCKNWHVLLSDENNDVWRQQCARKLADAALKSDLLWSVPSFKAKLRAYYYAWDPHECSRNIYIKPNGFTLHRNPVAQSTDAAKGKRGFAEGRHCWEVWWEGPLGTVAVVGIATREAPLQCPGYVALLGSNAHSWGWNLVDNHLLHNGDSQGSYPLLNNAPKYQVAIPFLHISCFVLQDGNQSSPVHLDFSVAFELLGQCRCKQVMCLVLTSSLRCPRGSKTLW